jgi:hypothetical protein
MTKDEFITDTDTRLRGRNPALTAKKRRAVIDAIITREESGAGSMRLWDFGDEAFRLEHLGYMLANLERERPELFTPAPTVEQTFNAKLGSLREEFGDDKSHPFSPDRPGFRRDLMRQIEQMSGDQREDFIAGLKIPAASEPEPARQETNNTAFTGPGDPAFRAHVATQLGIPEYKQSARANMGYFSAHVARLRDSAREAAKKNVAESAVKKALTPGEARTLARSKAKLVGAR